MMPRHATWFGPTTGQGNTKEEIADLLSIEPGTSKSQLFRARRALRRALEPPGEPT